MENNKQACKVFITTFLVTILFTSCNRDTIHLQQETELELSLKQQQAEQAFTIKEYCKGEYDSLFILSPYYYTRKQEFTSLVMPEKLRNECESAIYNEYISTILFISNGKVQGHAVVKRVDADFATDDIEENHLYPIEQKFIMDKERNVHTYKE